MNRASRRKYARDLDIKMPTAIQTSSTPKFKVSYKEYETKSRAGVKYKKYRKVLVPISAGGLLSKIFAK